MGGYPVTPRVLSVLTAKFNGKAVTLDQLVKETGLEAKQVQAAMGRLVADQNVVCTVVNRGHVWKFDGPASGDQVTDTLFEVVGVTALDGETIVRGDVSGKLYKVVPL